MLLLASMLALLSAAAAAPATGRTLQRQVLSEEPRIELSRGFLSQAESFALRTLAEQEMFEDAGNSESSGAASAEITGGEEFCSLNLSEAEIEPEDADNWAVVRRLGQDARVWAGANGDEEFPPVVVARWEPWRMDSALNRSGPLHLDLRLRPQRRQTVLAYLSGRGNADVDGSTVFPCVETDDMDPKEVARRQKLCSRAARHLQHAHDKLLEVHAKGLQLPPSKQYAYLQDHPELAALPRETSEGVRPVNWMWLPSHDGVGVAAPGSIKAEPLHVLAEAMCRGKAPGLRVASREGDALLMDLVEAGQGRRKAKQLAKPDWRLWHAGCSPLGEGEQNRRLTAQVFLEEALPPQRKGGGSCPKGQHEGSTSGSCGAAADAKTQANS